jgi:hypothetical protein
VRRRALRGLCPSSFYCVNKGGMSLTREWLGFRRNFILVFCRHTLIDRARELDYCQGFILGWRIENIAIERTVEFEVIQVQST